MMPAFVFQVILLLIVIGGAVAFIGNRVGKYIGKKRLTIFNLRPRHTAMVITVISGMVIALSTMAVILMVSQDARTALLGLERIKKEISEKTNAAITANEELQKINQKMEELTGKLDAAKKETDQLQGVKRRLSREITVARQGEVLFKKGAVISISLIRSGPERAKIEDGLNHILSSADANLKMQGVRGGEQLMTVDQENFNQTIYGLTGENNIFAVKLVADRNILWGEQVPARFELAENRLIYSKGSEVVNGEIPAGLSASLVEQEVMRILKFSHQAARDAGVLPDAYGSVGSLPYSQIYDLAKKIKSAGRKVFLKVLARKDIYTIGPLEVDFKYTFK